MRPDSDRSPQGGDEEEKALGGKVAGRIAFSDRGPDPSALQGFLKGSPGLLGPPGVACLKCQNLAVLHIC